MIFMIFKTKSQSVIKTCLSGQRFWSRILILEVLGEGVKEDSSIKYFQPVPIEIFQTKSTNEYTTFRNESSKCFYSSITFISPEKLEFVLD